MDGTLIEAWAGQKSFQLKDDDDISEAASATGSRAAIRPSITASKSAPTKRINRRPIRWRGCIRRARQRSEVGVSGPYAHREPQRAGGEYALTLATGTAERDAAIEMIEQIPGGSKRVTLGADRGYDTRTLWSRCGSSESRRMWRRTIPIGGVRSTRGPRVSRGYAISQRKRKRVEEVFGWMKTVALQRKTRFRGPDRVGWMFTFAAAAYNLVRMRNLTAQPA